VPVKFRSVLNSALYTIPLYTQFRSIHNSALYTVPLCTQIYLQLLSEIFPKILYRRKGSKWRLEKNAEWGASLFLLFSKYYQWWAMTRVAFSENGSLGHKKSNKFISKSNLSQVLQLNYHYISAQFPSTLMHFCHTVTNLNILLQLKYGSCVLNYEELFPLSHIVESDTSQVLLQPSKKIIFCVLP
jgi:hypothetical protein